jgi:predicted MFS family arabinose efflux permease
VGGIYTFSAAITGLVAALFLDRVARKKALLFCLFGLMAATFLGALVWDENSMLFARVLAGMLGGPLTSLTQAFIADYIPPERRGRAMGKVAGAFAAASVLGVPFGLELSSRISWHAPFIATGSFCLIALIAAWRYLPFRAAQLSDKTVSAALGHLLAMLRSKLALMSYAFMGVTMMAGFMIIPNIAAHLQFNIGYPRADLGFLYFCGGLCSFFSMRAVGWLVDKTSATKTILVLTAMIITAVGSGFVWYPSPLPVVVIFILFMVSMSGRMVAAQTLSSKIPRPEQRGAYMSIQSSITHFASATGAYYASLILVQDGDKLANMPIVGITAIALSLLLPPLFWWVERNVSRETV